MARTNAAPEEEGSEAGVNTYVRAVGDRIVASAFFARHVDIAIARFNAQWTQNGQACARVGFFIVFHAAGERVRGCLLYTSPSPRD